MNEKRRGGARPGAGRPPENNGRKQRNIRLTDSEYEAAKKAVAVMRADKYGRMIAAYNGHAGPMTIDAVRQYIPAELYRQLTGTQLGAVMSAINAAYHAGRASTGAEKLDDTAVYVDGVGIVEIPAK